MNCNLTKIRKIRGKKLWIAYTRGCIAFIRLYNSIRERRRIKRDLAFQSYRKSIGVINAVIKNWVSKIIKQSLNSVSL
jgi:hypothetical protein